MLVVLADILGVIGVIIVMGVYFLLQSGKMAASDLSYSFLNFVGSLLIIGSLIFEWNLAAFLMEFSWAVISIYGLLRSYRAQRES